MKLKFNLFNNCVFLINYNYFISRTVAPGKNFEYKFKFTPRIHGERKIMATFNAAELFDISGTRTITVSKA